MLCKSSKRPGATARCRDPSRRLWLRDRHRPVPANATQCRRACREASTAGHLEDARCNDCKRARESPTYTRLAQSEYTSLGSFRLIAERSQRNRLDARANPIPPAFLPGRKPPLQTLPVSNSRSTLIANRCRHATMNIRRPAHRLARNSVPLLSARLAETGCCFLYGYADASQAPTRGARPAWRDSYCKHPPGVCSCLSGIVAG